MNRGLTLIVSCFSFVQTSFREFGEVGLGKPYTVYKVFTKTARGPWLRGDSVLGPGVINCTPLSALSLWVATTDAFELWCWRRPLKVPWTARRSSQSILKEINPEYSLQRLMLKLRFQHFGHLMWTDGVYLWQIHFDIWQNQYNIVKLNKIKFKKKKSPRWERLRAEGEDGVRGWDG